MYMRNNIFFIFSVVNIAILALVLFSCSPTMEKDELECELYRISDNHCENYDSLVNAHVIERDQRTISITLGLYNNGTESKYIPFKGFKKDSFCSELLIGYGKKTFPVEWSSSSNFRNNIILPHDTVGLSIRIRNWMLREMGIEDSVSLATIQKNIYFVHTICKNDSMEKKIPPYLINKIDKTHTILHYRDSNDLKKGIIAD